MITSMRQFTKTYPSISAFPPTGGKNYLYRSLDTNRLYTWRNGNYVAIDREDLPAAVQETLNNKVDKVTGKGLSAEDYTSAEKSKLAGIAEGAQKNPGAATTAATGLMSAADKSKLDGITPGATAGAALSGTAPSSQAFGDAAAVGTGTTAARADHKHAMPAAPTSVTGNAGTATKLATARKISVNPAITDAANFNGSANITVGVAPILADGAAANTLPAAGTATALTTLLNSVRNCLKWITSKFGSNGALTVPNGGTGVTTLDALKTALNITEGSAFPQVIGFNITDYSDPGDGGYYDPPSYPLPSGGMWYAILSEKISYVSTESTRVRVGVFPGGSNMNSYVSVGAVLAIRVS